MIAVTATVLQAIVPTSSVLMGSDRLLLWPRFATALVMLGVWMFVWTRSRQRGGVSILVTALTLLATVFPLVALVRQWDCVVGTCYW